MPRLITPEEASNLTQINVRTLLKWARLGNFPGHPLGEGRRRIWRFFEEEILTWIAQREIGGKQ
jgi:excisionase family DNA binding protein